MTKAHTPVWELEYKIIEPFGRGHWTICESEHDARFHLRNIADNLPGQRLKVNIYQEVKHRGQWQVIHQSDTGTAQEIVRNLFGKEHTTP